MSKIRRSKKRLRKAIKIAGWSIGGFILLFCMLTVQLSATEGRSSRRQFEKLESATQTQSSRSPRTASSSSLYPSSQSAIVTMRDIVVDPMAFESIAPSNSLVPHSIAEHQQPQNVSPIGSRNLTTELLDYPSTYRPGLIYEVIEHQGLTQSMPSSNYFGVSPDQCCDEWSGFCDCDQKMFNRHCKKCKSK